jgi:hypothetical protein
MQSINSQARCSNHVEGVWKKDYTEEVRIGSEGLAADLVCIYNTEVSQIPFLSRRHRTSHPASRSPER